jgi:hypothetical protein
VSGFNLPPGCTLADIHRYFGDLEDDVLEVEDVTDDPCDNSRYFDEERQRDLAEMHELLFRKEISNA